MAHPVIVAAALVAGGAALLWIARSRGEKGAPLIAKGKTLALVGDSLGVGLKGPIGRLAKSGGVALRTSVEQSTRITQFARSDWRIEPAVGADVVLVVLGTNDAALVHPEDEEDELELLVRKLAQGGSRVVWVEPPATDRLPRMQIVRDMIRGSAALSESDGIVLDSTTQKLDFAPDGIHLTAKGYAKWADWIWQQLTET